MSKRAHGIMFHHFHDDGFHIKGQGSIDELQFERMITWLNERHNLLSAEEWYLKAIESRLSDNDVCITFDDNLKCQFDIALPVLEKFDLKAFWFIYTSPLKGIKERLEIYRYFRFSEFPTINSFYEGFNRTLKESAYNKLVQPGLKDFDSSQYLAQFSFYTEEDRIFRFIRDQILGVERYYDIMDQMIRNSDFDADQVSEILWSDKADIAYLDRTGHLIGLHSHTHPTDIKQMSYERQLEEYNKCKSVLSEFIVQDIKCMSHPCNSYNSDTLEVLRHMDVNFGFRANMEEGFTSSLEYPRLDHTYLIKEI